MSDEIDDLLKDDTDEEEPSVDPLVNPLGLHLVQLLLKYPQKLDGDRILQAMRQRCGKSVERMGEDMEHCLMFAHPDHMTPFVEGSVPAQTVVWLAEDGPLSAEELEADIQQTYNWSRNDVKAEVEKHQSFLLVTDLMASALPARERLQLFHQALLSMLDVVGDNCTVIRWMRAQHLINPQVYRKMDVNRDIDLFQYAVNIRMFRIQNREPGETLMDSMGMSAFNLPDVQCHFLKLDPADVAGLLMNAAFYLFQKGDVIEDGNTLPGLGAPNVKWQCQHEAALIGPEREVLDICPRPPFAAGNRG